MCQPQNSAMIPGRQTVQTTQTGQTAQTGQINAANGYYMHKIRNVPDARSDHMLDYHIGSVREAVRNVMMQDPNVQCNPYEVLDEPCNGIDPDDVVEWRTELHHSRGTKLAQAGNEVLEFDIGGSGFKQFRSEHLGVGGKGNMEDYMQDVSVHRYNKLFGWLPGVKSVEQIKKEALHNAKSGEDGNDSEKHLHDRKIVRRYGTSYDEDIAERQGTSDGTYQRVPNDTSVFNDTAQSVPGRIRKHILKSEKEIQEKTSSETHKKTRITMAGPLMLLGLSNSGEYSIENLRKYIKEMGKAYIEGLINNQNWRNNPHDIWIRLRGHSRGGVAAIEGAMMIKKWVRDNIPGFEKYIRFDVTQFDPVPGFGSETGAHKKVDMANSDVVHDGTDKMLPLGKDAETTVVYSLHTQHSFWFTPQEVANTKRIILTPYDHSVGLGEIDEQESDQGSTGHRTAFTDVTTGDAYRLSSLNDLPEGIYILDEQNAMVQIQSLDHLEKILESVLKDTSGQERRHEVIRNVVEEWFTSH